MSNDPRVPVEIQPSVLLRTTAVGKLLLKHNYGTATYAFDPRTRISTPASETEWAIANGQIIRCRHQLSPDHNRSVNFDTYPEHRATLNGQSLETHGRFTLFASESPTNSMAALLTASGWHSDPGIGLIGLGGSDPRIHGQLYLEVIDLPSGRAILEPVRISGSKDLENYRLCWAADERFIVTYKPYENFSVVEVSNISK